MLGLVAEVLDAPIVDRAVDKRWLGSGAGGRSTWTAVPEVELRKLSEPAGIESFDEAKLKRERHERVADVKPLLAESSHPSPDTADAASWRSGI